MRRLAVLALAAAFLVGCGTPAADLFVVSRSGSIPGAGLTLLASDDGAARCNSGSRLRMGDARLLQAREIARDLEEEARRGLTLPPGQNAVFSYRVRLQDGVVRFSDTSRGKSPELLRLAAFTRDVAIKVCGLSR